MENKNNRFINLRSLLLLGVIAQFGMIWYCNFTMTERILDYDSALAIRHAVDMWRSHTIFLQDFLYPSSMEIDCASFFAAPIYILTGNLSLAMGISHIFFDSLLAVCIYVLVKNIAIKSEYGLLAILLVFSPFAYGSLEYSNMIFLSVGQYEFRLTSVVAVLMMLTWNNAYGKKWYRAGLFITTCMLFITVLSTGKYIVMVLIFPIILVELLNIIRSQGISVQGDAKRRRRLAVYFLMISVLALAVQRLGGIQLGRTDMAMVTIHEFADNLLSVLVGVFDLFGGIARNQISIMSIEGIETIVKFIFAGALIILPFWAKKKELYSPKTKLFAEILLCIVFVNACIFTFASLTYGTDIFPSRYHLLWCIPLVILDSALLAAALKSIKNKYVTVCVCAALTAGLLIVNVFGFKTILSVSEEPYSINKEILSTADNLSIDSIIVYEDFVMAHSLNALDIDITAKNITAPTEIDVLDSFIYPVIDSRNMLVVQSDKTDVVPADILSKYEKKLSIGIYSIYVTENCSWPR